MILALIKLNIGVIFLYFKIKKVISKYKEITLIHIKKIF